MTRVTRSPAPARRSRRKRAVNVPVSRNYLCRSSNRHRNGPKRAYTKCVKSCARSWAYSSFPRSSNRSGSGNPLRPPQLPRPASSNSSCVRSLVAACGRLVGTMQEAVGYDTAMVHESFHRLHGAALSAEMVEIGIPTLRLIPRHQGKALTGLTFLEAGDVAQNEHPPVVRLQLLSAANIACERYIPDHVHLIC